MDGQLDVLGYLRSLPDTVWGGCGPCICRRCLYYRSDRCRYGLCYDDKRASDDPYDKAHPDEPPRDAWSDWDKPGEQAHWWRGGICYPTYQCDHFKKFMGKRFEPCIRCDTVVYQDGHRYCPLVEVIGCEACYESMMEGLEDKEIERC